VFRYGIIAHCFWMAFLPTTVKKIFKITNKFIIKLFELEKKELHKSFK
jgi:hypothetical protein